VLDVRSRYLADAVATAPPARLLTMLFDRLLLDLGRAEEALGAGRRPEATQHLAHGQEILAQLMADLDVDAWEGGERLLSIYSYALSQLIDAGRVGDASRIGVCRDLLAPIGEAWHQAAASVAEQAPATRPAATAGLGVLGVG
jgi:flagellar protein FliS